LYSLITHSILLSTQLWIIPLHIYKKRLYICACVRVCVGLPTCSSASRVLCLLWDTSSPSWSLQSMYLQRIYYYNVGSLTTHYPRGLHGLLRG
jgi:hypothetical protein